MFEEIYLNFVIIVYLSRKCFDMNRIYWSRPFSFFIVFVISISNLYIIAPPAAPSRMLMT